MNRRELIQALGGVAGIPAVKSVERLDVKPEDIVVLKMSSYLPQSALANMSETLKQRFPEYKFMILEPGIDIEVIRKQS